MNITVTGGRGFLGSHVCKSLSETGNSVRSLGRIDGDIKNQDVANNLIKGSDVVIHLAANVGGVGYLGNNKAASFYENLEIGLSVINSCIKNNVKRLVLASTPCVYADTLELPLKESDITKGIPSGPVTGYAFAKLAVSSIAKSLCIPNGVDLATFIPSNIYGPGDHFETHKSHVGAALIRKALLSEKHNQQHFEVWGNGSATRDFIYVRDVAESICKLAESEKIFNGDLINLGSGIETKISEFAATLSNLLGNKVVPLYQPNKPVGYQRRVLSCDYANELVQHTAATSLDKGLALTIEWAKATKQIDNWRNE